MTHAVVPLKLYTFLEKEMLKVDRSNYADWVRNLRIVLIAAQKAYVFDAPLSALPLRLRLRKL